MTRIYVVAMVLMAVGVARADKPVDARQHYLNGAKAYEEGDFQRAIDEYRASYNLSRKPLLLYDLGQAYKKLGNNELSLHSYKQFLIRSTEAREQEYRETAHAQVEQLEALIAEQQKVKTAPSASVTDLEKPAAAPPIAPVSLEPPRPPPPTAQPTPPPVAPVVASPPPRNDSNRAWFKNPLGWSLISSGVVVTAIGAGLAAHGESELSTSTTAPTLPQRRSALDSANTFRPAGYALVGIGAAALVGSVVVFALAGRNSHRVAALRMGGATLSLEGVEW